MNELCETRTMTVFEWIELASGLGVDGLELYPGFFLNYQRPYLQKIKAAMGEKNLLAPMFCVSPDFTHPEASIRRQEIEKYRKILDVVAFFDGETCRILSGQAHPGVSRQDGVAHVLDCFHEVLHDAAARNITLVMENHYKDNFWNYPEFAQPHAIFLEIVNQVDSPWFGVNYDPSNAILAGEDPLELLDAVKERVVSMHASDRYLKEGGTLSDVKKQDGSKGYSDLLAHGVIGRGLNDYDKIFGTLHSVGFDGWVSIEDGVNGMEELKESVRFLRGKFAQYWRK